MTHPSATRRRANLRVVASSGSAATAGPRLGDERILEAFERRDPEFGALLYERVADVVDGTLYRMLGRYEPEHEDLAQAALEQIVVTLAKRRFARACSLRSWAAALTTHLALNAIRRRGTERKIFDQRIEGDTAALETASASNPEREAGVRQELSRLRHALSQMSPKLAQTVVLHDALGHSVAEIAALTSASVSAAQSRLVRGRRKLEELLQSEPRKDER